MLTYQPQTVLYDDSTDVMYYGFHRAAFTDEIEVAPGIHVLYAYEQQQRKDQVVAIEIEYFQERYANNPPKEIVIPANPPFKVILKENV